uniref:Uncharacterized protein n=1 Tax=Tanacetum cinerariifolium TaxID=118510 RepID=A0A6L2N4U1_TANCI|nr:hypothetical protein [Tanacetum cinerariifolium]
MEAPIEDENAMDKGVADTVHDHKRKHDNDEDEDDDDEDPSVGPNQGKKKKRKRTKESESSKKQSTTKKTPKGKDPSKGSKTGKSASVKEPVEEPIAEVVMDDAVNNVVCDDDQPQDASEPKTVKTLNLEWFTQPPRPPTLDLNWNKSPGHLTVGVDYFFNNELEYLESSDLEKTYTTLITKTKASRYKIEGIEDMVFMIWSPTKVSVKKLHGYGHLEEIVVKRVDRQLFKFKEGDFVDLHMNDIKDMLLLAVRHKLFHLTDIDIVDFIVALRMFTRSLVIKNRELPEEN